MLWAYTLLNFCYTVVQRMVRINKNTKMSSIKSSENIQKKEGGPDRSVSDIQSSSVSLNKLAMKARKKHTVIFEFLQRSQTTTDINPNGVQISKHLISCQALMWF